MSEHLPYEDAFEDRMNDLPMPDEEQAWQKMKELLDEDDRKRRILPPIFFSCALWSVVGLTLLAGGWWLFFKEKKQDSAPVTVEQQKQTTSTSRQSNTTVDHIKKANENETTVTTNSTIKNTSTNIPASDKQDNIVTSNKAKDKVVELSLSPNTVATNKSVNKGNISIVKANKRTTDNIIVPVESIAKSKTNSKHHTKERSKEVTLSSTSANSLETGASINNKKEEVVLKKDFVIDNKQTTEPIATDSTIKKDTLVTVDTTDKNSPEINRNKKSSSKKLYTVSVGIGEQQSVNIKGQASVPYNYYGRTSSLSDYIPSVYVRLHRGDKWFLQGEFRYGAPQSVKEFSFSQQMKYDTLSTSLVTTSTRIKKTFYHQIPLSINYYILPHWSVGIGAMYSLFHGAITEQDVKNKNLLTGAETNTKMIVRVPAYTDSFLYKTQWHVLFQTDYQWKRFSIGLRYQRDLQPFIKYTDPAGVLHAEKNQSFDVFIRFQLWKSKPFHF